MPRLHRPASRGPRPSCGVRRGPRTKPAPPPPQHDPKARHPAGLFASPKEVVPLVHKSLLEKLREQRTTIRAGVDKILDRSGHDDVDLSADELATFNKLVAQDRDLE